MTLEQRLKTLIGLGKELQNLPQHDLEHFGRLAKTKNGWFTQDNVEKAIRGIAHLLEEGALKAFVNDYNIPESQKEPKTIGVVMAGNLPFVGFHDMLMVLLSGHKIKMKLSSQDQVLPTLVLEKLFALEPSFKNMIEVAPMLKGIDAIIATGSDNSSRYFEHYFSKYPNIIRKNRVSVALVDENITDSEMRSLADDIFAFYGLGCRNVAKVYVPEGFQAVKLAAGLEDYGTPPMDNHKYSNNFDYQKSVLLVNQDPHLDNGSLLFKASEELVSPISVLFYEHYKSETELLQKLQAQKEKIQCLVSRKAVDGFKHIPYGKAQTPDIDDFADGVDTMRFLLEEV